MKNTQIFRFEQANIDVRMIEIDNTPHFVLRDVIKAMGRKGSRTNEAAEAINSGLGEGYVQTVPLQTPGGRQETAVISKSAVTFLVSRSNTELGKALNRWIHTEVIPAIEQTGRYEAGQSSGGYQIPQTYAEALKAAAEQAQLAEDQRKQLEAQKPKVLFAEAVETSSSSILIRELAVLLRQNGIMIGQQRLFTWLREHGYLIKRKGTDYNMPTQRSMELGLFEVKETAITHNDGRIHVGKTTKVKGKGQSYFINKFVSAKQKREAADKEAVSPVRLR